MSLSLAYTAAIHKFIDQEHGMYFEDKKGRQVAEYMFNAGVRKTIDKLLWTRNNEEFTLLAAAEKDGKETGGNVDYTKPAWYSRAQATLAYVQTPSVWIQTFIRKQRWIPRVPQQLLQAAIDDMSHPAYQSMDTRSPTGALALAMLAFYGEYLNKADIYQLQVDVCQLSSYAAERDESNMQSALVVRAVEKAIYEIIGWRRDATDKGQPKNGHKLKKEFILNLDGEFGYEVNINPFLHHLNAQPCSPGQLDNQQEGARRHVQYGNQGATIKDHGTQIAAANRKSEQQDEELRLLKRRLDAVMKAHKPAPPAGPNTAGLTSEERRALKKATKKAERQRLRDDKQAHKSTGQQGTDTAVLQHLGHMSQRQVAFDRAAAAHEFLKSSIEASEKIFGAANILDHKNLFVLDETRGSETLTVLMNVFVNRADPSVGDVDNETDLDCDAYIRAMAGFLPAHLKRWASDRARGRPVYNAAAESHHQKPRDNVKDWLEDLRDQCKLPSQTVLNEQAFSALNIFDFIRRGRKTLNDLSMPTIDQVKAEIDLVYRHFSPAAQARAIRQALQPHDSYWLSHRAGLPHDKLNRLREAVTPAKEWKCFSDWARKRGKQIEDGTQRTFSETATDASEAASLRKRGITSPAKGLAAPSAAATLAAVQEAQPRLQIGEHCAKCGTGNHTTMECHLSDELAKAGLDLHAKLTNFEKSSKNCPQYKDRMDIARKLKYKPSTSGIFGPDKFGCPSCHRQGMGDYEDHWLKDCPNDNYTSSADGGHSGGNKKRKNKGSVFAMFPEPKKGGKKKRRKKSKSAKSGKQTVTMTMTKEAAAALGSGQKGAVKAFAAFSKECTANDETESDDSD